MAAFTNTFLREHDIDVCFKYCDYPIHIATGGSLIPQVLNDKERINTTINIIKRQSPIEGNHVHFNEQYIIEHIITDKYDWLGDGIDTLVDPTIQGVNDRRFRLFCKTFYYFSIRGFYSYYHNEAENCYCLVASPSIMFKPEIELAVVPPSPNTNFDPDRNICNVFFG